MPSLNDAQIAALNAISYEWQPPLVGGRPSSSFDCLWRKGMIEKVMIDRLPYYKLRDDRPKGVEGTSLRPLPPGLDRDNPQSLSGLSHEATAKYVR